MRSYGSRILEKALAPTIRAIDVLGFTLPPIVAAYYWLVGRTMPEEIGQAIGLWILGGGLTFIAVRLLSAPYFVWREDQARIAELQTQLDAPERQAEAEMRLFTTGLRKEISKALGELAATVTQPKAVFTKGLVTEGDIWSQVRNVDRIISQISYDVPARIASIQFRNACVAILAGEKAEGKWFYRQRQITFRILHRDDLVNDLMSLMELEIELEKRGESTLSEGAHEDESTIEQLKGVFKALGDRYYDPDVRKALKGAVRDIKS